MIASIPALVQLFLSTPSARRATEPHDNRPSFQPISIHALREEGDVSAKADNSIVIISTHPPREEGDGRAAVTVLLSNNFYPRPPRGGRLGFCHRSASHNRFLSTPSARRATFIILEHPSQPTEFLSTPSARRATTPIQQENLPLAISIHALREEGDADCSNLISTPMDFYPRPPRGGRPWMSSGVTQSANFYPRPPRGGRPLVDGGTKDVQCISIHALREEGDDCLHCSRYSSGQFLSTPSARRATC